MALERYAVTAVAAAAAGLAARYAVGQARVERSWLHRVEARLTDLGEVDDVSVLPLVERLTPGAGLRGEAGVSYLVRAGGTTLLFDCGLGVGRSPTALAANAAALKVDLSAVDGVVISHRHIDHVGGWRPFRRHSFAFSGDPLEPRGAPAFVPVPMEHVRTDVVVTDRPRVIARGMAVLPPLPRMLFWPGMVSEQVLVVNVAGFGLVLVSGCGHPRAERILAAAEHALDVPIRAVVGGLHLPVHPLGTGLVPQAVLGSPKWPWQPIDEDDAREVIEAIAARGPRVVALSSHDSTPWTFGAFAEAFGDRYRTLRVGEAITIDRQGVPPAP